MSGWNLRTGEPSDVFLLFSFWRSVLHKNSKLLPFFSVTPTKEGDQLFILRVESLWFMSCFLLPNTSLLCDWQWASASPGVPSERRWTSRDGGGHFRDTTWKLGARTMWIKPKGTSPSRKSRTPHVERLSRNDRRGCQEQLPFLCLMKNFGIRGVFPTHIMWVPCSLACVHFGVLVLESVGVFTAFCKVTVLRVVKWFFEFWCGSVASTFPSCLAGSILSLSLQTCHGRTWYFSLGVTKVEGFSLL